MRQPSGEICVNTLKKDWKPGHDLRHVLMVIRCLLIEPFPESALNEDAAKLMLENYDEYFKRAQMLTNIHALSLNGVVNKTSFNSTPRLYILNMALRRSQKLTRRRACGGFRRYREKTDINSLYFQTFKFALRAIQIYVLKEFNCHHISSARQARLPKKCMMPSS